MGSGIGEERGLGLGARWVGRGKSRERKMGEVGGGPERKEGRG